MPKEAAEYRLENGDVVFIEADVPTDYGEEKVSIFGGRRGAEKPRLAEAVGKIVPALEEVCGKIAAMALKPNEIAVELGIKFVGETGVVIARASTESVGGPKPLSRRLSPPTLPPFGPCREAESRS